jgi:hypothetical protein
MPINHLAIAFPESGMRTLREVIGENLATSDALYAACLRTWSDHLQGRVKTIKSSYSQKSFTSILGICDVTRRQIWAIRSY